MKNDIVFAPGIVFRSLVASPRSSEDRRQSDERAARSADDPPPTVRSPRHD